MQLSLTIGGKTMTTRKTYTAEFKRHALELAARKDVGWSAPLKLDKSK